MGKERNDSKALVRWDLQQRSRHELVPDNDGCAVGSGNRCLMAGQWRSTLEIGAGACQRSKYGQPVEIDATNRGTCWRTGAVKKADITVENVFSTSETT
jgi:hypothetical protein